MLSPLKPRTLGYEYKFFGLGLRSNLSLPGIPLEREPAESCDLTLQLGAAPYNDEENKSASQELKYVSPYENEQGQPVLKVWKIERGAYVRIAFGDGTQFWLDRQLRNVWATWSDDLPIETVTCYLLGPVLGLLLRLRGVVCLHASAVVVAGRGVVFMGSAGAGKSTTAAAFSKLGYPVLCDDISALEERGGTFFVNAAHPQIGLWPDSVEMLYGTPEALPRLSPTADKRRLILGEQGTSFGNDSFGLAAIYVLGDRQIGASSLVESMRPQTALLALVADSYASNILDRELRAGEFEVLGRLVSTVAIRRIHASEDPGGLDELCRVIREDLRTLGINSKSPD
jgi:hypothetical protein